MRIAVDTATSVRSSTLFDPMMSANSSFSRQLCAVNAVPVQYLVVVHRDGHLDDFSGELEGALVVGDRRAAIASDIEASPRDEIEEAEPRLDAACRHVIDQQREFAETLHLSRETTHADTEPAVPRRYRRGRSHHYMLPSDIHVVDKMTGLQIQAVAGGRIAMGDEDTFTRYRDVNVGLDQIAATPDVGRNIRRQVSHAGMENVVLAETVEAARIRDEALPEAVVDAQHLLPL